MSVGGHYGLMWFDDRDTETEQGMTPKKRSRERQRSSKLVSKYPNPEPSPLTLNILLSSGIKRCHSFLCSVHMASSQNKCQTCVNIKDAVSRIVSQTQIFKIFLLQVSQSPARSLKPIKSVNASTFAISFFLPENTCAQVCATRVFSSSTLTPEQFLLVDCYFSQ
jgi:hypothetical protein